MVRVAIPVETLAAVMLASGTPAPVGSVTAPYNVAFTIWPDTGDALSRKDMATSNRATALLVAIERLSRRLITLPPRSIRVFGVFSAVTLSTSQKSAAAPDTPLDECLTPRERVGGFVPRFLGVSRIVLRTWTRRVHSIDDTSPPRVRVGVAASGTPLLALRKTDPKPDSANFSTAQRAPCQSCCQCGDFLPGIGVCQEKCADFGLSLRRHLLRSPIFFLQSEGLYASLQGVPHPHDSFEAPWRFPRQSPRS